MKAFTQTSAKLWQSEFLSPKYLLLRALTLFALFLLVQLAGMREYTIFLSGTAASPEVGLKLSAFYGMIYISLYIGTVVVAPILVLAAGVLMVLGRLNKTEIVKS